MGWWGMESCSSGGLLEWIRAWSGMCPRASQNRVWSTLFFAMIWTIWEARNELVFKGSRMTIEQATDLIKFQVAWWFKHHGKCSMLPITTMLLNLPESCSEAKVQRKANIGKWIPPIEGAFKFNVDGSSRGNPGSAGIGGVLRDSSGKILGSFSLNVGYQDEITAELLAIHKAVNLCV
ncbi:hypothetical protein Dsin_032530 [Dipteronia sinensis]|uniref:RNase H type-1 domain-containing protein n=1 Tax=Dipteronia sinensis TaxID=43782 RepID=A0AAE0DI88_9ROSI|nr:hypothetical protein Dsin_032530 [Dipteronia sinensis]